MSSLCTSFASIRDLRELYCDSSRISYIPLYSSFQIDHLQNCLFDLQRQRDLHLEQHYHQQQQQQQQSHHHHLDC